MSLSRCGLEERRIFMSRYLHVKPQLSTEVLTFVSPRVHNRDWPEL
jgi:hypothetical protein